MEETSEEVGVVQVVLQPGWVWYRWCCSQGGQCSAGHYSLSGKCATACWAGSLLTHLITHTCIGLPGGRTDSASATVTLPPPRGLQVRAAKLARAREAEEERKARRWGAARWVHGVRGGRGPSFLGTLGSPSLVGYV